MKLKTATLAALVLLTTSCAGQSQSRVLTVVNGCPGEGGDYEFERLIKEGWKVDSSSESNKFCTGATTPMYGTKTTYTLSK
jgi:hypothetical protein